MNNKKNNLNIIRYKMGYKINETPRYRPLIDDNEQFDEIPLNANEIGEQQEDKSDPNKPEGGEQVEPSNDQPIGIEAPEPAFADDTGEETPSEEPVGIGDEVSQEPEQSVDKIQNDIIKHNIDAMKSIHQELENLNNIVSGLNTKFDTLNSEVEEVREPTDSEKLMNKSEVSYPYYFNLNDLWSDNWFDENREIEKSKGIKKLPDGTFIADFDDLTQYSKHDIQNSFNDII